MSAKTLNYRVNGLEAANEQRGNYRDSERPNIRCCTHADAGLSFRAAPEDVADPNKDALSAFDLRSVLYVGERDAVNLLNTIGPTCI